VSEDVSTGQPAAVLERVLDGASTATVTCTSAGLLFAAVAALHDLSEKDRPSETRLLTTPRAAKRAERDFVAATTLADLRASAGVELRTAEEPSLPEPAVVTEDAVFPVLRGVPCRTTTVRVTDETFRDEYREGTDRRWDDATGYDLDTFRRSQFLDSLEGEFGGEFRQDFERALAAPDARSDDGVDPVDLLVLLAAKHGEQSYELNRWGESFGVASVGKFSQSKRRLEEIGLVETEKVRSESVGRPRQRLVVGKEELADATPEELVDAMRTVSG
jgi:hypothetical protein